MIPQRLKDLHYGGNIEIFRTLKQEQLLVNSYILFNSACVELNIFNDTFMSILESKLGIGRTLFFIFCLTFKEAIYR